MKVFISAPCKSISSLGRGISSSGYAFFYAEFRLYLRDSTSKLADVASKRDEMSKLDTVITQEIIFGSCINFSFNNTRSVTC